MLASMAKAQHNKILQQGELNQSQNPESDQKEGIAGSRESSR